jgi:uncharacterized membrane protein YfcA
VGITVGIASLSGLTWLLDESPLAAGLAVALGIAAGAVVGVWLRAKRRSDVRMMSEQWTRDRER